MTQMLIAHLKKSLLVLLGLSVLGFVQAAEYEFDKTHTEIIFTYSHLGNSTAYAEFDKYEGSFSFDLEKPENSQVEVVIQMASIDTGIAEFDGHLKDKKFFNIEEHPTATYKSKSFKAIGKNKWLVSGDLTMKGITRPMDLYATVNYVGEHPLSKFLPKFKGKQTIGLSLKGSLLRSDFDMGAYAPLTDDKVKLILETELIAK